MSRPRFEYNCDQRASAFSKVEGKDYCHSCKTMVHDLRGKSREEVARFMNENGGSLCAKMYDDQFETIGSTNSGRKKILVAGIASLLTATAVSVHAQAADTVQTVQADSNSVFNPKANCPVPQQKVEADTVQYESTVGTENAKLPWRRDVLVIGRRHFYITSRFPFYGSRKVFMGRYASASSPRFFD